jgi:hypothetical protein
MSKYILSLFLLFFWSVNAHELGIKTYALGKYEKLGFDYPASLTDEQLMVVLNDIDKISGKPITDIRLTRDHIFNVTVCTKKSHDVGKCLTGESYLFGQGKESFTNFSITPTTVEFLAAHADTEEPAAFKEFSNGVYSELPFYYSSSLTIEQITLMVEKFQHITSDEINSVYQRHQYQNQNHQTYEIMTCTNGSRFKYLCIGGDIYEFNLETYDIIKRGPWVQ